MLFNVMRISSVSPFFLFYQVDVFLGSLTLTLSVTFTFLTCTVVRDEVLWYIFRRFSCFISCGISVSTDCKVVAFLGVDVWTKCG